MESFHSRSRGIVLALPVLMICFLAGFASAQGSAGWGLPGLPSVSGFFGRGVDTCGPTALPNVPLAFYVGWGEYQKGARFSLDPNVANTTDLYGINRAYPIKGLWLGLAAQANVSGSIGVLADGWLLVPSSVDSLETGNFFASVTTHSRNWSSNPKWWFLDAAMTLNGGMGKVLAGFRYDNFQTQFNNPTNISVINALPTDESDLTVQLYMPFVGVQTEYGSPGGTRVALRIIGFPWLASQVKYEETVGVPQGRYHGSSGLGKSYFLEAFAEFGRDIFGSGNIGLFLRWNLVHAQADQYDIIEPFGLGAATEQGTFGVAFDRQSWTAGGSFSLAFNMPNLGKAF